MIEIFGWVGTLLVLIGYFLNVKLKLKYAIISWILGDIMWITYDILRGIYPHLSLSAIIIIINVYGLYKLNKLKTK